MNKFKIIEYVGAMVIAIPVTADIFYYVINKNTNFHEKTQDIENIDSMGNFVLVEPVKVEVKKIETPEIKKEPVKKVDSIVKPKEKKEITEESKKDTSKMYFE